MTLRQVVVVSGLLAGLLGGVVHAATAQTSDFLANAMMSAVVRGAPYSADGVTTVTQILGDGTRIARSATAKFYRDSEGRVRREQTILGLAALNPSSDSQLVITIVDPVAGVTYTLNPATKVARRTPYTRTSEAQVTRIYFTGVGQTWILEPTFSELQAAPPPPPPPPPAQPLDPAGPPPPPPPPARGMASAPPLPRPVPLPTLVAPGAPPPPPAPPASTAYPVAPPPAPPTIRAPAQVRQGFRIPLPLWTSLGAQQIEALVADGRRTRQVIPAGLIGNDRPIEITSEWWESRLLQVLLVSRVHDPRTGDVDFRLTNIRTAEPPPELFTVPAGYTIVDAPPPPPLPPGPPRD